MSDTILAPTLITSAVALFTIANPIGTLPIFLEITKEMTPQQQRRTGVLVGFAVIVVLAIALIAGSVALLADAGHNLSDVLGLLIAWGAATLARRSRGSSPTRRPPRPWCPATRSAASVRSSTRATTRRSTATT